MTFFGNSSRPDIKGSPETGARAPRSEATLLGDATQILGRQPEMPPPSPLGGEPRAAAQQGPTPPDRCTNVIAAGARWQGTLTVEDSVRVDGNFSGEINAKGTVHVADGAQVDAKVRAAFVVVSGSFRGEIRCEQRVDLLPRSRVNGEVITKVLSVQEGAIVDGRVQMTGGVEAEGRLTSRAARATGVEAEPPPAEPRRERAAPIQANSTNRNGES